MPEWRDVVGYEDQYSVSDEGLVRTKKNGVIRRGRPGDKGYLRLQMSKDGVAKMKKVHLLVAAAFLGPCPDGMQCCHDVGIKTRNAKGNLRWDTPKGNQADRVTHGTASIGVANGRAKLTADDVRAIRARLAAGEAKKAVARAFSVSPIQIMRIATGKQWSHI